MTQFLEATPILVLFFAQEKLNTSVVVFLELTASQKKFETVDWDFKTTYVLGAHAIIPSHATPHTHITLTFKGGGEGTH